MPISGLVELVDKWYQKAGAKRYPSSQVVGILYAIESIASGSI